MFYISVTLTCGATTSENCTYLTLAATATVASTQCSYTICPASSTVSRIKLDLTVKFKFYILVNNLSIIQSRHLPTRKIGGSEKNVDSIIIEF